MTGAGGVEVGRAVADAVLLEGYLLYPYRASAAKNQVRWQFGVLFPRAWADAQPAEAWSTRTEVLLEPGEDADLQVVVRCLQAQRRTVEQAAGETFEPVAALTVGDTDLLSWVEGIVEEREAVVSVADLMDGERTIPFELPAERLVEEVRDADQGTVARIVRERGRVTGLLRLGAERIGVPYDVVKLRVQVENLTPWPDPARASSPEGAARDEALQGALIAAHTLVAVSSGAFVSSLDPPEWARAAVAACDNQGAYPVLVGTEERRDVILSSPIILYDHPEIAAESPGEMFDATEIDEILLLRTLALTDEEKREARATDRRAGEVIDRADTLPPELWERLHGAVRSLRPAGTVPPAPVEFGPFESGPVQSAPWWDPGADTSVSPETDSVWIGGVAVSRGSSVRLAPSGRSDAQDMFLAGREGTVEAVLFDVDDHVHLAVTLVDDPGADLQTALGRYRYFSPDEVEPL